MRCDATPPTTRFAQKVVDAVLGTIALTTDKKIEQAFREWCKESSDAPSMQSPKVRLFHFRRHMKII